MPSGCHVVGADVAGPRRLRRIAVLREHHRLAGGPVDQRGLVLRIDRRDGDSVDALRQQIVDDTLLLCRRAIGGNPEFRLHVRQFLIRLLDAATRDRPEVRRVVGDERQFERLRVAAAITASATRHYACDAHQHGDHSRHRAHIHLNPFVPPQEQLRGHDITKGWGRCGLINLNHARSECDHAASNGTNPDDPARHATGSRSGAYARHHGRSSPRRRGGRARTGPPLPPVILAPCRRPLAFRAPADGSIGPR